MVVNLIQKLYENQNVSRDEFIYILDNIKSNEADFLKELALQVKQKYYGTGIFLRGLIEFSNYCKNDCYYCGIRLKNHEICRYRLTEEQILDCCAKGYELGMRTFVLQGGEDTYFDDKMVEIVRKIRRKYEDCAITLSIGELSDDKYEQLFQAGANRFLLRHETATYEHYKKLHPQNMTLSNRKNCLFSLKNIGFHTGAGFMVGSPYQTNEHLANDLIFLSQLKPHMVGIGPFIPHKNSIFANFTAGTLEKTLIMLSLTRLILPKAMMPSTTALESIEKTGRVKAFLSGANVIMVNISPNEVKKNYMLYDNKAYVNTQAENAITRITNELKHINMELLVSVGNPVN